MARRRTKERIIETARTLFHVRGFHATSLADILDKAAVNAGSLYYFFKSKDDLLLAVLDAYVELLGPAVMAPAFARTDDPIERIFRVLAGYRRMLIKSGCTLGCPIGNLALELADAGPAVHKKIALNFANWCRAIEQCLDAAAHRLPTDLDRARLSRFVLTVMEGGIMQARGHRSIRPYDEAVAQLRDYFNRLLKPRVRDRRGASKKSKDRAAGAVYRKEQKR
jgi:TetR/AcrR family transcriptional repressor of nem operon